MPTCQNCDTRWSWKQTFKTMFTLDTAKICPYCGEKQYVTSRTRNKTFVLTFIIIILIFLMNFLFGHSFVNLFISIGFLPLFAIIYPFLVDLANEENFP